MKTIDKTVYILRKIAQNPINRFTLRFLDNDLWIVLKKIPYNRSSLYLGYDQIIIHLEHTEYTLIIDIDIWIIEFNTFCKTLTESEFRSQLMEMGLSSLIENKFKNAIRIFFENNIDVLL